MLSDLLKVYQGILQPLANGGHATKRGPLERLALEQRLCIFEESHIVSGDSLYQSLCCRYGAEGYSEVVGIIEGIEKIFVERVNVLQPWKAVEDGLELLAECFRRELDLSRVKVCKLCQPTSHISDTIGVLRILLILKPARICVGSFRCVRDSTMSINSCDVGTGAISFHVVFILVNDAVQRSCYKVGASRCVLARRAAVFDFHRILKLFGIYGHLILRSEAPRAVPRW